VDEIAKENREELKKRSNYGYFKKRNSHKIIKGKF